ncbi:MAG TPA: hypothetical protein VFR41_01205 [Acidimicrobiia bacterium]|nr:hypothetical protein [Acidimicrobiia bacterium]
MTRRPAHGATQHPPVSRPGSGFGRPVRPRPPAHLRGADAMAHLRNWNPMELLVVSLVERDSDLTVAQ